MFTGLIEAVGEIAERRSADGAPPADRDGVRLCIASELASELSLGDSLAVNGVCLTVAGKSAKTVHADVGPETLRVTTLGSLMDGACVNLERPLRADGRLGGHFVQGHVDAVGCVEELRADENCCWLTVSFPPALAPYIVLKGSIAVDGISLTVARMRGDRFEVQIVPYTLEHTNLKRKQVGEGVNLECDLVGKYVVNALRLQAEATAGR